MPEHHHRSTLKQQNKSFKGSSSSKRAIKRINKGKVPASAGTGGGGQAPENARKAQRVHAAKQVRDAKRQELLKQRRGLTGSVFAGPRVVGLLAVTKTASVPSLKAQVLSGAKLAAAGAAAGGEGPVTAEVAGGKVTVVETGREMIGFLDCMSVADVLVLVAGAGDESMDALGQHLMLTARNFALPSVICLVVQGLEASSRAAALKKWSQVMGEATIREDFKVFSDTPQDQAGLLRFVTASKLTARPAWQQHASVLAQSVSVVETGGDLVHMQVSGYVKSKGLSADQLVHIPSYGTYQVKAIERWADPLASKAKRHTDMAVEAGEAAEERLEASEAREELTMEEEDDGMEGEQTWPSQEELQAARLRKKKVPKFMGEYASCWIPDDEDEEGSEEGDGDMDMEGEGEGSEAGEEEEQAEIEEDEEEEDDMDETMSLAPEEEERARSEWAARRADEQEQRDYPDEVEVPADVPARQRFARYRGLRSLRTSPWDPYENLPQRHHKIIHLSSPAMSRAKALKTPEASVPAGSFVTIHIERVPKHLALSLQASCAGGMSPFKPLVLGALAGYENRMGLVHWRITSYRGESNSVKSKDTLVLVQGSRRMEVRPVFSEASESSNNHRMLRYLPGTGSCVASAYAPITWGPGPVLLMQKQKSGAMTVVAVGSTLPPNANRIILKRIVLSGLPFKIHKRKATIRFMFYNPEDIRWFKAVELWTKFGRRGIIREPLGTHGYMKATFDSPIAHHDTVCMSLYKRVFPPYPEDPAKQLCSAVAAGV